MAIETERKFLVTADGYRHGIPVVIKQGYICSSKGKSVRVRIKDDHAYITVKDATVGFSRHEFEYEIPVADAEIMLQTVCEHPLIEKVRWIVEFGGHTWEVDVFDGENSGLVVAEIELENADASFPLPDWVGREVTGDERYYNARLFKHPYSEWR